MIWLLILKSFFSSILGLDGFVHGHHCFSVDSEVLRLGFCFGIFFDRSLYS